MKIDQIRELKVGDAVTWYETIDGRRTGFRMGYYVTRINYKRGLVWGHRVLAPIWDHRNGELNLDQIEKDSEGKS